MDRLVSISNNEISGCHESFLLSNHCENCVPLHPCGPSIFTSDKSFDEIHIIILANSFIETISSEPIFTGPAKFECLIKR